MSAAPPVLRSVPGTAAALVQGVERLIAFPEVWIRTNRLIDAGRSAAEIARALEMDTDLSARLLRMVNSSFYRLAAPVETVSRAVTVLGTLELRDLAMLTVARRLFRGIPADLMDTRRFWRDAVATGLFAGLLGRRCNLLHAERTLVMGVIHNIGLLVICQYLPEQARDALLIARGDDDLLPEAEREILGYTHQEVGAALLQRWNLPDSLCQVAAFHHHPEDAASHRLEVAIIHVAALLTTAESLGLETEEVLGRLHLAAADYVPTDPETLEQVREQGRDAVAEMAERFLGGSD
jgi:HD-like signal output (HDOD) protein